MKLTAIELLNVRMHGLQMISRQKLCRSYSCVPGRCDLSHPLVIKLDFLFLVVLSLSKCKVATYLTKLFQWLLLLFSKTLVTRWCLYLIDNSCEAINHQLTIARFGDSLDKKDIGITPDPFGGVANYLKLISATPEKRAWETRLALREDVG